MSSFTTCKYSFVVYEFLIILKRATLLLLSKTHHSKHFILKSNAGKTRTNIHHDDDDDDDETRCGRGCRACGATSDGDVQHLASSFFFFFFVVVFDDDSQSPHSGEYKRQVEHGIPIVVTIEKRNNAKRK